MKNDEILLSVKFENDKSEFTYLMKKDLTLLALLEALYYGLKKKQEEVEEGKGIKKYADMFEEYAKTRKELEVRYRSKDEANAISIKENLDKKLYELGFVTGSCILILKKGQEITDIPVLFPEKNLPAVCDNTTMEYNISTRRIATPEHSVINILPPGAVPGGKKRSWWDVFIPTLISMLALCMGRVLLAVFNDNASGFSMIAMVMVTSVSTMVVQSYNVVKQGKEYKNSREEWKTNYQEYLNGVLKKIVKWQEQDVMYLRAIYPTVSELFQKIEKVSIVLTGETNPLL